MHIKTHTHIYAELRFITTPFYQTKRGWILDPGFLKELRTGQLYNLAPPKEVWLELYYVKVLTSEC